MIAEYGGHKEYPTRCIMIPAFIHFHRFDVGRCCKGNYDVMNCKLLNFPKILDCYWDVTVSVLARCRDEDLLFSLDFLAPAAYPCCSQVQF